MTTRRRLNNLESQLSKSAATDIVSAVREHGSTLARIQGRVDGLFWPARHSKASKPIWQRQKDYRRSGGILWRSEGQGTDAKWKSDQRLRSQLKKLGLIHLSKTQSGVHVRLTRQSEAAIRQACGLPFVPSELASDFEKAIKAVLNDRGFVSEDKLFDATATGRPLVSDWYESEELIVSLLIDGSLEATTSMSREIFYRLGDSLLIGLELVKGIEVNSAVRDVYLDSWESEINQRGRWEALDSSEVFIPLPASF